MGSIRQMKPRTFGIGKCETCGKEFMKKSGSQRFCSLECRDVTYERYSGAVEAAIQDNEAPCGFRRCKVCGELFELKCKGSRALYCSDECKKLAAKQRAEENKYKRSSRTVQPKSNGKKPIKPPQPKDGFTWAEIRAVLGEFKIGSYQKAVEILQQRKRESEAAILEEIKTKGGDEE